MNNEDPRKKNTNIINPMQTLKQVPSINFLSKKLSEGISKQKQNDKLINADKKSKQPTPAQEYDDKIRKNPNLLNFKTLGKYNQKNQRNDRNQKKNNKEKKQKQSTSNNQQQQTQRIVPTQQQKQTVRISDGISINFNIQNMIQTKKSQPSQRSLIKQDQKKKQKPQKRKKKVATTKNQYSTIDDFECQQILDLPTVKSNRHQKPQQQRFEIKDNNVSIFKNINLLLKNDKSFENQIRQFQIEQSRVNLNTQIQQLLYLTERQSFYSIDAYYIQKKQKHFSWLMRAILIQWMMHVNTQYCMKRQTYHVAVVLTDLYFTKTPNVLKSDLQLVGAASMYIASKLQQEQPLSVVKFVNSTSGKYSSNTILEMQTKICRVLKWNLNPPTINMWANKIMLQWDLFLQVNDFAKNHQLFEQKPYIFFKKSDQKAYQNFRQVMQLIDCSILDIQSFQYKPKLLVCSFLYLVLGKQFQFFNIKQITTQFHRSSRYIFNQENTFNDLYKYFIEFTFAFSLFDLLPSVQYCATYFILPMTYECPDLKQIQENKNLNFEEFSSYQTYNSNHLAAIKKRNRGIYDV